MENGEKAPPAESLSGWEFAGEVGFSDPIDSCAVVDFGDQGTPKEPGHRTVPCDAYPVVHALTTMILGEFFEDDELKGWF